MRILLSRHQPHNTVTTLTAGGQQFINVTVTYSMSGTSFFSYFDFKHNSVGPDAHDAAVTATGTTIPGESPVPRRRHP